MYVQRQVKNLNVGDVIGDVSPFGVELRTVTIKDNAYYRGWEITTESESGNDGETHLVQGDDVVMVKVPKV